MRTKRFLVEVMIAAAVIWSVGYRQAWGGSVPKYDLSFKGSASGGTLVLAVTRNRNQQHVSIVTSPGESAESVARRLADAINAWNASPPPYKMELWGGGYQAPAEDGTITLPSGVGWALAGTEKGLGIPAPPRSLSCSYDKTNDNVVLRWINPPDGYDSIIVHCFWTDLDHGYGKRVAGTSNSFTIERKKVSVPVDVSDFDAYVVAYRNNIPSNSAGIHLSGHCQSEIFGIPFAGGVAPNWTAWSTAAKTEATAFEEGKKYFVHGRVSTLSTKPFYQVIKAPQASAVHGVLRKFLGLTPGHRYRLTACLNTLEMDSIKGSWSFSLCAAYNGPDVNDLSVEQLAGLAPLPNGSSGLEAGRIGSYSQNNTTEGKYAIVLSHDEGPGGLKSSHITLPSGVDTITVWVRFSCSDPDGKVAFSGVKLEDITASGYVEPARGVIGEELSSESSLLEFDAKIKAKYGIED